MKKKVVIKKAKKSVKVKKVVKKAVKKTKIFKAIKPIGAVTHFYGNIKVAIVKFKKPVKVGTEIAFRGATVDFTQTISSMQYEHQNIQISKKGKEVGIKTKKKVHEGDLVYLVG